MTQGPVTDEPIAVITGPNGTAEIFEYFSPSLQAFEYRVTFKDQAQIFNNLGEAYLTAEELAGKTT